MALVCIPQSALAMITPPPKRLRMKTPDPARKHKSPDPRALKKAQKELKESRKSGSSAKDPTSKKLTFGKNTEHVIQAEHDPPKKAPSKPSKDKSAKMTPELASSILERFAKARWLGDCSKHKPI